MGILRVTVICAIVFVGIACRGRSFRPGTGLHSVRPFHCLKESGGAPRDRANSRSCRVFDSNGQLGLFLPRKQTGPRHILDKGRKGIVVPGEVAEEHNGVFHCQILSSISQIILPQASSGNGTQCVDIIFYANTDVAQNNPNMDICVIRTLLVAKFLHQMRHLVGCHPAVRKAEADETANLIKPSRVVWTMKLAGSRQIDLDVRPVFVLVCQGMFWGLYRRVDTAVPPRVA